MPGGVWVREVTVGAARARRYIIASFPDSGIQSFAVALVLLATTFGVRNSANNASVATLNQRSSSLLEIIHRTRSQAICG